jgi:hypothetical protein
MAGAGSGFLVYTLLHPASGLSGGPQSSNGLNARALGSVIVYPLFPLHF